MATITVSNSIQAAINSAANGDTIVVPDGRYTETVTVNKSVTLRAENQHKAILDGGYGPFTPTAGIKSKFPHPAKSEDVVRVSAANVTIDGVQVIGSSGHGIAGAAGCDNLTVKNCLVDFCYDSNIMVNPGGTRAKNITIDNCFCYRGSQRFFDPQRGSNGTPQAVSGGLKIGNCDDVIIRDCVVAYSMGEGINPGKGDKGVLVERTISHDNMHAQINQNGSQEVTIKDCILFHRDTPLGGGEDGDQPPGITYGDETSVRGSGITLDNVLIVGVRIPLTVRVGSATKYDTTWRGDIRNCTFIPGAKDGTKAISLPGNPRRPHISGDATKNIIEMSLVKGAKDNAGSDPQGVRFFDNAWSHKPAGKLSGPNDYVGPLELVNAGAAITAANDLARAVNFNPANYVPKPGSPAMGYGVVLDRLPPIRTPGEEPPPPPPPDDDDNAPAVRITAGPDEETTETTATFKYTVDDEAAVVEYQIDDSVWSVAMSPVVVAEGMALGAHTFRLRATDEAGNAGRAEWEWTIVAEEPDPDPDDDDDEPESDNDELRIRKGLRVMSRRLAKAQANITAAEQEIAQLQAYMDQ